MYERDGEGRGRETAFVRVSCDICIYQQPDKGDDAGKSILMERECVCVRERMIMCCRSRDRAG